MKIKVALLGSCISLILCLKMFSASPLNGNIHLRNGWIILNFGIGTNIQERKKFGLMFFVGCCQTSPGTLKNCPKLQEGNSA